jgi:hypothetical protein
MSANLRPVDVFFRGLIAQASFGFGRVDITGFMNIVAEDTHGLIARCDGTSFMGSL